MGRRAWCVNLMIGVLFFGWAGSGLEARMIRYPLDKLVYHSDLIVEGRILDQETGPGRKVPERLGGSGGSSVLLGFGKAREAAFVISRVYKGKVQPGDTIVVVTHRNSGKDFSDLKPGREYVLFLRRDPRRQAYLVAEEGRGEWLIFTTEGRKKVKAWHQGQGFRPPEEYQDYQDFLCELSVLLADPALCETP